MLVRPRPREYFDLASAAGAWARYRSTTRVCPRPPAVHVTSWLASNGQACKEGTEYDKLTEIGA